MNRISPRNLKKRASILVQENPGIRRIFLIYAGVFFGVTLLVSLLQMLLNTTMTNQAGLAGMGTSAIFMTAQSALSTICEILLPFWQISIIYCTMRFARQQSVERTHLMQGFRKWGPVLRYYLWLIVLAILLSILLVQGLGLAMVPVMMVYIAFVPMPDNWMQSLENMEEQMLAIMENPDADPSVLVDLFPTDILMYMVPVVIIMVILILVAVLHLSYRIRLSQYLLMEEPGAGAIASVSFSNRMMKGNKWGYFKLDLSFWWYYLLQIAVSMVLYAPEILDLCGVMLPISDGLSSFLFQLVYSVLNVALMWKWGAYVQTTYACVYDVLRIPRDTM